MRYNDVVHFEPIESVKQLRAGSSQDQAAEDVRSYVISESMCEVLTEVVIPQLRLDNPDVDHKGLLLVATYGTGKTHLMSAIAGVAEHAELAPLLTNPVAASEAARIAGGFKVIRVEIGAVRMGLRDLLAKELQRGLAGIGVTYEFPPLDQVVSNKDCLADMMAAFQTAYPEHGLLLVVDELLDYLRTRRDTELILDLGFLREMGEFCQSSWFRIIAGVQEMLWDNPRFALAQDEIRRMRERFQQFRISREDVAFVVQQRLLRKDDAQKGQIREHLQRFAPGFESMAADLPRFVELFPVHPSYLRTFEGLTIVEKRRVLETLSAAMRGLLDKEVPTDEPGLVCFDEYRTDLEADPSNRVIPEVKEVLDRGRVLRERVSRGLKNKTDVGPALRIVDALTVHRLTTDDLNAPIGLTPEELRDDLCLLPPGTPELDPSFIASTIETIVGEIRLAVSGQFLSVNEANGQVYIDLKKTVDYEQQVEERAATLDEDALDSAYYKALERVLEVNDDPYVSGYRIWRYELPWAAHRVTRLGYLFMGAPNERSTAQPPRDFYVYFLQPYSGHAFDDEHRPDEVFLRLVNPDEVFTRALRRYAGAVQKAVETTTQHRAAFEQRRDLHLSEMVEWLRRHMATNVSVTYLGQERTFGQWLGAAAGARRSVKDQVDTIAAQLLAEHFDQRYPDYPRFSVDVTHTNLGAVVTASLQSIARRRETTLGKAGLDALQLVDIEGAITADGPYARHLQAQLEAAAGKAVNRQVLLVERDLGVPTWGPWHLEPGWLVVVAAALVYLGKAELGLPSGTIGATQLERLADTPLGELEKLTHVVPPAGLDLARLRRIATLVSVIPGEIHENLDPQVVVKLITQAEQLYSNASDAKTLILDAPRLWGEELFDDPAHRITRLDALVTVVADVRSRTTAGKMRNVTLSDEAITRAEQGKKELDRVRDLRAIFEKLNPVVTYLMQAADVLGDQDPKAPDVEALRARLRTAIRGDQVDKTVAARVNRDAQRLRDQYRTLAVAYHEHDRLDGAGDAAKQVLVHSSTWLDLGLLSQVSIIPEGKFASLEARLATIGTCKTFTPGSFDQAFICPDCKYRPTLTAGPTARASVDVARTQAEQMRLEFLSALRDSLAEEELSTGIPFLPPPIRGAVQDFIATGAIPSGLTEAFVAAANQLLQRFRIVKVDRDGLWTQVLAQSTPLTPDELVRRFTQWLDREVIAGEDRARVRIVPVEGAEE